MNSEDFSVLVIRRILSSPDQSAGGERPAAAPMGCLALLGRRLGERPRPLALCAQGSCCAVSWLTTAPLAETWRSTKPRGWRSCSNLFLSTWFDKTFTVDCVYFLPGYLHEKYGSILDRRLHVPQGEPGLDLPLGEPLPASTPVRV